MVDCAKWWSWRTHWSQFGLSRSRQNRIRLDLFFPLPLNLAAKQIRTGPSARSALILPPPGVIQSGRVALKHRILLTIRIRNVVALRAGAHANVGANLFPKPLLFITARTEPCRS